MSAEVRWVNPSVLRWARERLRLTPDDVARESRALARSHFAPILPEELLGWEEGTGGEPTLAQLETLAEIYLCPVGWFFLDAPPQQRLPLSLRGGARDLTALSAPTRRAMERFFELARWTVVLLGQLDRQWEVRIRPREISPSLSEVEERAREYRQRLGWTETVRREMASDPREAFHWWRRTVEGLGVFCFELPLDPQEVRGAALWHEGIPFILVNHEDREAATGRIFTLLHEFAHLVSAEETFVCDFHETSRRESLEPFANRFAARLLLTPEELIARLEQLGAGEPREEWSDSLLDKARQPFFVSRDVVAILLEEMGLAPRGFYEQKRQQWEGQKRWGRGGRRPTRNEQKLQEVGYSMLRLLDRAAQEPGFSWMDAALMLGLKVEKLEQFLQWARTDVLR